MRSFAVLLSLSLFLAAGCGTESATTMKMTGGAIPELETVDSVTLPLLMDSQSTVLVEFTADW